jgi:hypothetical protein
MDLFHEAYKQKLAFYAKVAPLLYLPTEHNKVPFNKGRLVDYLRRPAGVNRPPVVFCSTDSLPNAVYDQRALQNRSH